VLVDILLARGINGESPVKKRTPRKKAARAPKSRPSAASRVARSKTPRTGSSKRAARKSAAIPSDADENYAPPAKKRHDTSKSAKLPEGRRIPGTSLRLTAMESLNSLVRCARHRPINARSGFILHGHVRPLSTPRYCPTGAFCRPARRCQCALLCHSNSSTNAQLSFLVLSQLTPIKMSRTHA